MAEEAREPSSAVPDSGTGPSDAGAESTWGAVLLYGGAVAFVAGIVLLVSDNPVGLLVLMSGLAASLFGLDETFLAARRRGTSQRPDATPASLPSVDDAGDAGDAGDDRSGPDPGDSRQGDEGHA